MRIFLAAVLLLAGLTTVVYAQAEADNAYISIYGLIQQAENMADTGEALAAFKDAQSQLLSFQKNFPGWNPNIVGFRLNQLTEKITALNSQSPAPSTTTGKTQNVTSSTAVATNNNPELQLPTEIDNLRTQLQAAQTANKLLQAKLKEALSVQPAAADPRELEQARQTIRDLMKQNDLLKASADSTNLPEAKTLMITNTVYITNSPVTVTNVVEVSASNSAPTFVTNEIRTVVVDTNALADLRGEVEVAKLEKLALQEKLQQALANTNATANVAELESRIRELTLERDRLMEKLDLANRQLAAGNKSVTDTSLVDEVNTLRARLAVTEAQPVPYSAEELALFKAAVPSAANPDAEKKSLKELPAGTAELAVSAERHFVHQEFDAAEADYLKILERDQNNGIALANLATIELQENKLAEAEKHITAAVRQSPNDAYNLSTLGYLKFRQEKYDDALDALSRAAQINPDNPEIQNYLGVTLSHQGQRKAAETALRRAIQLNPNYAPAHNNLAVIYLGQTPPLPELARWHYQKALDAGQPRNPDLEKMLADKGAPVAQ